MSEWQEHREVIRWFREEFPEYYQCTRLSLNGVNLPAGKTAAIMINQFKAQGMVKGEADLFFAVPSIRFHGLFVEMKAETGGKVSEEQRGYLDTMSLLGYQAKVTAGAEAAKEVISNYMEDAFILHEHGPHEGYH